MKRTSSEVTDLRQENGRLKQVVAEMVLENRLSKKNVTAGLQSSRLLKNPGIGLFS